MIRYDSAYNQKINRVVSNFNQKVRRLEKEEGRLLPSTVSVKEIKSQFMNRRDLNVYLRELERFGKKGAENIVNVGGKEHTEYEIDIFKHRLRRERERLNRDIESERLISSKYPMQHNIAVQNMMNRREKLSESWGYLINSGLSEAIGNYERRLETYDNYFNVLFQDAYQADYDEEKLQYIREKLMELSPSKFIKALENSPEIQEIFNYYHSLTRRNSNMDENEAKRVYDKLYDEIDEIVKKYK